MQGVTTVRDLRTAILPWREAGDSVALVPTMGALHEGHRTLVAEAKKIARRTVASVFVNPLQFGPNEDFGRYPRDLEADRAFLAEASADLLYAPQVSEMFPESFAARIDPGPLATVLEGAIRPGHFAGVATVVTKLLSVAGECRAASCTASARFRRAPARSPRKVDESAQLRCIPTRRAGSEPASHSPVAKVATAAR